MTHTEMAWEFAEVFSELPADQINEVLAKNVPVETLDFFLEYAESFSKGEGGADAGIGDETRKRLPNLMLLGYLLRVLEERLLGDDDEPGPI